MTRRGTYCTPNIDVEPTVAPTPPKYDTRTRISNAFRRSRCLNVVSHYYIYGRYSRTETAARPAASTLSLTDYAVDSVAPRCALRLISHHSPAPTLRPVTEA
eukprot:5058697-Pleurochrysis_carterae.AAC.5